MRFTHAVVLLFAAFAAYGAYSDIRFRTIPNLLNVVMALTGLIGLWLAYDLTTAAYGMAHLAVALAIGLVVYALGLWGGGDGKFYAASAAWFELKAFPRLAAAIAIAGLILVIVWFGMSQVRRSREHDRRSKELPYGVAIAAGGIATAVLGLNG